jgi:hypothetical protein
MVGYLSTNKLACVSLSNLSTVVQHLQDKDADYLHVLHSSHNPLGLLTLQKSLSGGKHASLFVWNRIGE